MSAKKPAASVRTVVKPVADPVADPSENPDPIESDVSIGEVENIITDATRGKPQGPPGMAMAMGESTAMGRDPLGKPAVMGPEAEVPSKISPIDIPEEFLSGTGEPSGLGPSGLLNLDYGQPPVAPPITFPESPNFIQIPPNCQLMSTNVMAVAHPGHDVVDIKNKTSDEVLALLFDYLSPIICTDLIYSATKSQEIEESKKDHLKKKARTVLNDEEFSHAYVYLYCILPDSYKLKRTKDENQPQKFIADIKKNMIPKSWKRFTKMVGLYTYYNKYRGFALNYMSETEYDQCMYNKWLHARHNMEILSQYVENFCKDVEDGNRDVEGFSRYVAYWLAILNSWPAFNIMARVIKPVNPVFKLFVELLIKHPFMPILVISGLSPIKCLFLNVYITQPDTINDLKVMSQIMTSAQTCEEEAAKIVNKDSATRFIIARFRESNPADFLSKFIKLKLTTVVASKKK